MTLLENNHKINAKSAKYMSDFMTELPKNCRLHKGITGCGGTTLAIQSEKPYIIVSPFTTLISSKKEWAEKNNVPMACIFSQSKNEDTQSALTVTEQIRKSIKEGYKKFMVTYESLPSLTSAIVSSGGKLSDFNLLVDEYHLLLQSVDYRGAAIDGIMKLFDKFGSYCFMTATPINDEYLPPVLRNIPSVEIIWDNVLPVNVSYKHLKNPKIKNDGSKISDKVLDGSPINKSVAFLAGEYLCGAYGENNAYFFINSVKSIAAILNHLKKIMNVSPDDIRILCSDNKMNRETLSLVRGSKRGSRYNICNSTSEKYNKKVTFLTAKCFEGCDFYDEFGVTYIVTDGRKDQTKYDITTTLPQIVGRIRNSKYKNDVSILYSSDDLYRSLSEKEFVETLNFRLDEARLFMESFAAVKNKGERATNALLKEVKDDSFFLIDEEAKTARINDFAIYAEMSCYYSKNKLYYVKEFNDGKTISGMKDGILEVGSTKFDYKASGKELDFSGVKKAKFGKKADFSKLCIDYIELMDKKIKISENIAGINTELGKKSLDAVLDNLETIAIQQPIIAEAYHTIGKEKMKALEFRKPEITRQVAIESSKSQAYKFIKRMNLKVGVWLSDDVVTKKIKDCYDYFKIDSPVKNTFLLTICECKRQQKRIDGVQTHGWLILSLPEVIKQKSLDNKKSFDSIDLKVRMVELNMQSNGETPDTDKDVIIPQTKYDIEREKLGAEKIENAWDDVAHLDNTWISEFDMVKIVSDVTKKHKITLTNWQTERTFLSKWFKTVEKYKTINKKWTKGYTLQLK